MGRAEIYTQELRLSKLSPPQSTLKLGAGLLGAIFPIELSSGATEPGQGRAAPTKLHQHTPTAGCRSGEWMMIRLHHTSCCTLPRTTRLPRHHPRLLVGCQRAHIPSCSTTGERQSFKDPEHTFSYSQIASWTPLGVGGCSGLPSNDLSKSEL